jgi:CRP-like cAMP-binding protein
MKLLELMRRVELFSGLDDNQIQRLIAISQEHVYKDNQVIFAQGDEGDTIYIINEGQVEISVGMNGGRIKQQVYLGQGQIFGEMALIDYGPRSATARSVRDRTSIQTIGRDAFTKLCSDDRALGYVVMRNLAIDLSFKLRHRNLDPNQ